VKSAALIVALAATAFAQQWEFEVVDTGRIGGDLQIRQGGGKTYLGYVGPDGQIRLANKDSIWRYDDLDTSLVVPNFSLAVSPDGEPAVAGLDTAYRSILVQHFDTGWTAIWSHERLEYYDPLARVAFSPTGAPLVSYCLNLFTSGGIVVEARTDTTWHPDTAAWYVPSPPYQCQLTLYDLDCDSAGNPLVLIRYASGFPGPGMPPWSFAVIRGNRGGGEWTLSVLGGGYNTYVYGYDITASRDGTPCATYYVSGYLRCEQDAVWPELAIDAAVRVDAEGRRHIAFVSPDSALHYGYKTNFWHITTVPTDQKVSGCDLLLDTLGEPLIAYSSADGVWLAHGVDIVGQSEEPREPTANGFQPTASVIRSVLFLPRDMTELPCNSDRVPRPTLLDAAGRAALTLHPGANDVSKLAPGVYFVTVDGTRSTVHARKVVVTR
jgi:hypothetical protein